MYIGRALLGADRGAGEPAAGAAGASAAGGRGLIRVLS